MKKAVAVFAILALSVLLFFPIRADADSIGGSAANAKPKITNISVPASILQKCGATISFKVSKKCSTRVEIYDSKNKTVYKSAAKTVERNKTATFKWNGKNTKGAYVGLGTYKVKLIAGKKSATKTLCVDPPMRITNISVPASVAYKSGATLSFKVNRKCSAYIAIYDSKNTLVYKFAAKTVQKNGTATFKWNGKNTKGGYPYYGKYTVRLTAGNTAVTKNITVGANITKLKMPDTLKIGQEALKFSFVPDQNCSAWAEVFKENGDQICEFEKLACKKGQTVNFAWDWRNVLLRFFYDPGTYWVALHTDSAVYKKKISAYYPSEGTVGNFYVKILDAEYTTDILGDPAIRIYYSVKNISSTPYVFNSEMYVLAYQDADSAHGTLPDTAVEEDGNAEKTFNPGESAICAGVFNYSGGVPLTLEISCIYDYYSPMIQKTYSME
jgi:flagellar hook assembly protein FlgD